MHLGEVSCPQNIYVGLVLKALAHTEYEVGAQARVCIKGFVFFLYILKPGPSFFSCYRECCKAVLQRRSQMFLWTMKLLLTFHRRVDNAPPPFFLTT